MDDTTPTVEESLTKQEEELARIEAVNPELAAELRVTLGKTPTTDTGTALQIPEVPDTVTSDNLTEQTPIVPVQPAPTPQPAPTESLIQQFDSYLAQLQQPTQEQEFFDATTRELQTLYTQLAGESEARTLAEQEADIVGKRELVTDLTSQLKQLVAEQKAIPIQLQQEVAGRGVTGAGLRPIQSQRLRDNAIQQLGVSAMAEAAIGNLSLAEDLVDKAVKAQYDPIRAEINAKMINLQLLEPILNRQEKRRAEEQRLVLQERERFIQNQEAQRKAVLSYAAQAARFGASSRDVMLIQSANSEGEALALASRFLGREFAQKMEAEQFDRDMKVRSYNLSVDKFLHDMRMGEAGLELDREGLAIRREGLAIDRERLALDKHRLALSGMQEEIEKAEEKNEEEKANILKAEMLAGKLELINGLIDHKGLNSRVGPTPFARVGIIDKFGAGQDFAGMVHQLVDKETLDMLINVKAQGATFGALSDRELGILQNSATKINQWEIKKDGEGIGKWNASQKSFKEELEKILELTQKAYERATGIVPLTAAEQAELDALLQVETESIIGPANYY